MTLEEYFAPSEFDIRRVSLAVNAKLSIDELTFKESARAKSAAVTGLYPAAHQTASASAPA